METKYAVHLNPVWRDRANFIIHAQVHIEESDSSVPRFEQLWSTRINNNQFMICCIPFFVYGLALGDEVETHEELEKQYVVSKVVASSGRSCFRVWFGDVPEPPVQQVLQALAQRRALMEFYSKNLLAVDAESPRQAEKIANLLQEKERLGHSNYEVGKIEPTTANE